MVREFRNLKINVEAPAVKKQTTTSSGTKSKEHVDEFNDEDTQSSIELSEEEAQRSKRIILGAVRKARETIYHMFCGGFRALNYKSFNEFVESLPLDHSSVYRQKNAAVVELRLGLPIGKVKNESVLRKLYAYSAKDCRLIWARAKQIHQESGATTAWPTAKMVTQAMVELEFVAPKRPDEQKSVELIKKHILKLTSESNFRAVLDALKAQRNLFRSEQNVS